MITGRIFQKTCVSVFSGFNFALLGLFFFMLFFWLYYGILRTRATHPMSPFILLVSVLFVIFITVAAIMLDLKNPQVGVFAHLGGFLLGLLIPAMVGIILVSKGMKEKVGFAFLLIAVLAVCAGFWLVL
jgi:membrane associated rhomboid family serine protease